MRPLAVIVLLALAGCASAPPLQPATGLAERSERWAALENWRMTGRVALAVAGEGASANLDWRQAGATSDLALSGPLGMGALRAILDPAGLRLEDGSGAGLAGEEAASALAERLGMDLPLEALRFWVLGIPAPAMPYAELTDGTDGFSQAGWRVEVDRYATVGGGLLPTRMVLWRADARLRLVVSRWELAQ